jgi:hypothetical protein
MNEFNQNPTASAQGLASLGRGPDTMLVHMAPQEVQSLQGLAALKGGSLTINPSTGLPEAGFLSDILPMIVGVGASFVPGLNVALNPLTMGLLAGAGAGIASKGDVGEMLKWGLGVGGGAGIGKGLSALGAGAKSAVPQAVAQGAVSPGGAGGISTAAGAGTGATAAQAAGAPSFGTNAANFGTGLSNIGSSGVSGYAPAGSGIGPFGTTGGKALAAQTAMAAAPFAVSAMQPPEYDMPDMTSGQDDMQPREYAFNPGQFVAPTDYELQQGIENQFFTPDRGFTRLAAQGGIMTLGGKSGGYLDGPGDGMSDSIPGSIANKQPARLADGEFVIPADVVSHLGNGSSSAGAKQLYSLMDRVREARTGNPKQGKQINPNKFMPA